MIVRRVALLMVVLLLAAPIWAQQPVRAVNHMEEGGLKRAVKTMVASALPTPASDVDLISVGDDETASYREVQIQLPADANGVGAATVDGAPAVIRAKGRGLIAVSLPPNIQDGVHQVRLTVPLRGGGRREIIRQVIAMHGDRSQEMAVKSDVEPTFGVDVVEPRDGQKVPWKFMIRGYTRPNAEVSISPSYGRVWVKQYNLGEMPLDFGQNMDDYATETVKADANGYFEHEFDFGLKLFPKKFTFFVGAVDENGEKALGHTFSVEAGKVK